MQSRLVLCFIATLCGGAAVSAAPERLRIVVETDAGGDPDDEQSLVRFLLYANEWDVQGIIANRARAREGENKNPVRDGLGIVRRQLGAYGEVYPKLRLHDERYPTKEELWKVTVAGYDDVEDGVELLIRVIDERDARPVWFCNWGTDKGSAESCLKRALDKVLKERGKEGYARFKSKLRLSSDDRFGAHTWEIEPAFSMWVYTLYPEMDGGRWYRRFSVLTKTAGGFDVQRDVITGHGPLGALYPLNTNPPQKEGDTPMFLRLVPNGLNEPEHPEWGSWAGRFGKIVKDARFPADAGERRYYCPNQRDTIEGVTNRDLTLSRWAEHIQNDFRARLEWCVRDYAGGNHAPVVVVARGLERTARAGETVELDGTGSSDPDGQTLSFRWVVYPEATGYRGIVPKLSAPGEAKTLLTIPGDAAQGEVHVILQVTDSGKPALTRYGRIRVFIGK